MNHRIHTYLELNTDNGSIECRECGERICDADENYKEHCGVNRRPVTEAGEMFEQPDYIEDADSIEFRQFVCQGCGVLFDFEISLEEQAFLHDIEIDLDNVADLH
jgi:acetone carboxylase gamma subunit